jgi:hypothetical protein
MDTNSDSLNPMKENKTEDKASARYPKGYCYQCNHIAAYCECDGKWQDIGEDKASAGAEGAQNPTGFNVGDKIRHSGYVIQRARDYWLKCGREPMKSGAKADLDKKTNARGIVKGINKNRNAWSVFTEWQDGHVSDSLSYMLEKA